MKRLLVFLAACAALSASAQTMSYNADANSDGFIGSPDLLTFLPLYGTQVGLTDSVQTCNYDGTDFEDWIIGVLDLSIIVDSIRVSYLIEDSLLTYSVGCPDGSYEYASLERSYLFNIEFPANNGSYGIQAIGSLQANTTMYYYQRQLKIEFNEINNQYRIELWDYEISGHPILNTSFPFPASNLPLNQLPFDDVHSIDSTGLHLDWNEYYWAGSCTYLSILPYWHYAE